MKWLQDFKLFELMLQDFTGKKPSAHVDPNAPRIADNENLKKLIEKYDLEILTSSVQNKHGVVRLRLPNKSYYIVEHGMSDDYRIYESYRIYTLYPTGVIRGDTTSSLGQARSQYVLFRLFPDNLYEDNKHIESNEDINKMVNKLESTIIRNNKSFDRFVEKCKKIAEKDPSFLAKCPIKVLKIIKPKLVGAAKLGILDN